MAFNITNTLKQVVTHLQASGRYSVAMLGEPKAPPVAGAKIAAAVYMRSGPNVVRVYAGGAVEEVHVLVIRLYQDMLAEPAASGVREGNIELELSKAVTDTIGDIVGDYDLNSSVMTVDIGGIHGTAISTDWGYVDIGGKMFRVADIGIPFIVNDDQSVGQASP